MTRGIYIIYLKRNSERIIIILCINNQIIEIEEVIQHMKI